MKNLLSKYIVEFKFLIRSASNIHLRGKKKDIFIFSVPRAGSTWLMEIISSQPGIKFYDEPFNIRRENVKRSKLFNDWEFSVPGYDKTDMIFTYLKDLQKNRCRFMNPAPFRRNHRLITNRIVFKIHEIEYLINNIKDRLNAYIVFLIRHPIANTISREQIPRLKYFVKSSYFTKQYLTEMQKREVNNIFESGSKFEKGILSWCLQNLIPLNFLDKNDWLFLSYEELMLNPRRCCDLICKTLELEKLDVILKAFNIPATNIKISSRDTIKIFETNGKKDKNRNLVKKWKQRINPEDERKAFNILELFGIDIYKPDNFIPAKKYLNFPDYLEILL